MTSRAGTAPSGPLAALRGRGLALVLATSGALLLGALGFQHLGGYAPCEMCMWQRWGHVAVIAVGLAAWALRSRPLAGVAAVALLAAAGLGLFHAGVEYGWWQGLTGCTATPDFASPGSLGRMLAAPLARCDTAPWTLGLSMAGWNAVISASAAFAALMLGTRYAPR